MLLCTGGPALARTDVCYQGGTLLPNFQLNGSALLNGTDLLVTSNQANQNASIMYIPPFAANSDIHIQMQLKISQAVGGGADGMSFVMHIDPRGAAALGDPGGGIGYGGMTKITPSVVVEIDTYQNGYDANNNHVAIMQDGDETNHLAVYDPGFDMRAAAAFYVWIDYSAAMTKLDVYVSNTATKPGSAQLTQTINLAAKFGSTPFYMGFTGSTGGAQEQHEIVSFVASDSALTSSVCCTKDADCQGNPLGSQCDSVKHVCGQCSISSTSGCTSGMQSCNIGPPSNTCISPCTSDFGSGMAGACPLAAAAVCLTSGTAKGSCTSCNGNYGSAATHPCPAAAPACQLGTGWCGLSCKSDTDCGGTTPACNTATGVCVQCTTQNASACTGGTPVCNLTTAACVQCTSQDSHACSGTTPVCNTTSNLCIGCRSDADCGGNTPACDAASGACVQCTSQNATACRGGTPVCNGSTKSCVQCDASNSSECTGSTPVCNTNTNTCGQCNQDSDCTADADNPLCNTGTGTCGQCTATDVSHCPAQKTQCEQVNVYNVCVEPHQDSSSGCGCDTTHSRSTADIAAVALALLFSVSRRRRSPA